MDRADHPTRHLRDRYRDARYPSALHENGGAVEVNAGPDSACTRPTEGLPRNVAGTGDRHAPILPAAAPRASRHFGYRHQW